MANISTTDSTYGTGGLDTRSTLDGTDLATYQQMNGAASAAIAVETILGDGPTLKGNKADLAARLSEALNADGKIIGHTIDGRTNTVAEGAIINAETTGIPAVGIGTAIKFQAESQDEVPSDAGRIGFTYDNVTAANETTRLVAWLRVAGNALSNAYEWSTTSSFTAIFSQNNSANRVYVFPDASINLVGHNNTQTLTNKTIDGNSNTLSVGINGFKMATGSASGTLLAGGQATITANDYSFPPNFRKTGGAGFYTSTSLTSANNDDFVSRYSISETSNFSVNYTIQWRYFTNSDDPAIWILYNATTGKLHGVWVSDDPLINDISGIEAPGLVSKKLKAADLQFLGILRAKEQAAIDLIAQRQLKTANVLYRALQLYAGNTAPSQWLLDNCQVQIATGRLLSRGI